MVNHNLSIQITERDQQILSFINEFGFCELKHLNKKFNFNSPRNNQILKRLIKAGLINYEKIFHQRPAIYYLTRKGAQLTELPPMKKIPLAKYNHDLFLIDTYLKLKHLYPQTAWISERQLVRDKHLAGVGQRGHLPDGILVFPDGKQIAIEVELTIKSKARLEKILKTYISLFHYQEVWYYCTDIVANLLYNLAIKMPFIKVNLLQSLLQDTHETIETLSS
ncbi:MAG: hypothetical protein A3E87_06910 [Gammaproteobacteria bacterium RIFCSPHIGHO2_12_FULL_35_23]|nr:MAG: hypothetical protein A3E87_06910 [Gammaproteobacteria bacterium RIFCSPHIGHO2_12_FULL_35_23]